MHQMLKLQHFDSSRSLDTFLLKFWSMASYLHWNKEDTLYHLYRCLEGAAGQVLWDIGPHAMTADVIQLLQTRFGTHLQAERFEAELHTRQRGQDETLQMLYQDICRLVTLAYPSADGTLTNHVGKEAFITALKSAVATASAVL